MRKVMIFTVVFVKPESGDPFYEGGLAFTAVVPQQDHEDAIHEAITIAKWQAANDGGFAEEEYERVLRIDLGSTQALLSESVR